ncbi:DUF3310 domain-containing protein [Basilea psittacipulmonis]|uniref:Uncharacterized protein n=1 Tax=Basilea psittacipulmonis DSM 24701 TaxID=1072685 RepID=A0A077DJ05_9BURK|nr:DUF3310 domain-containing protein [Basilea psittacipulmonis]AIL33118.1 hypothetical protein IX83_07220 [Basilea psittacipulmonis DSM 24701]
MTTFNAFVELEKVSTLKNPLRYAKVAPHYTVDTGQVNTATIINILGRRSYFLANAFKYLSRLHKKGQLETDVIKAYHCLRIAERFGVEDIPLSENERDTLTQFIIEQEPNYNPLHFKLICIVLDIENKNIIYKELYTLFKMLLWCLEDKEIG